MKTKENHNKYLRLHEWLRKLYGNANHCDQCEKPAKRFEWALRKGYEYEFNRDNFIQLCPSCHRKYDLTQEFRYKCSERMKLNTPENFKLNPHCRGKYRGDHCTAKKIMSIDNNDNIEYFDSLSSAKDKYDYKIANISMCLTGKNMSAYEKQWKYC